MGDRIDKEFNDKYYNIDSDAIAEQLYLAPENTG